MSKQWGHGFHNGRMAIIRDLLSGITLQEGCYKAVYLRQVGRKYCTFECPACMADSASFKMTANAGWCDNCGADFQNFSTVHELTPVHDYGFPDAVGVLECYCGEAT